MKKSTLLTIGIMLSTLIVSSHLYSHAVFRVDEDPVASGLTVSDVKVFPNPSDGRFQLSFDYGGQEKLKAKVYDITGKLVKDVSNDLVINETSVNANIDLESPGSGIYFIRIEYGQSLVTKKIIIR